MSLFSSYLNLNASSAIIPKGYAVFKDAPLRDSPYDKAAHSDLETLLGGDVYQSDLQISATESPVSYLKARRNMLVAAKKKAEDAYDNELAELQKLPMVPVKDRIRMAQDKSLREYEAEKAKIDIIYNLNPGEMTEQIKLQNPQLQGLKYAKAEQPTKDYKAKYQRAKAQLKSLDKQEKASNNVTDL